jgi:hypothetical protein
MAQCYTGLYRHPPHRVIGRVLPGVRLEGGRSKVAERSHSTAYDGGRWTVSESGRSPGAFSFSITSVATDLTCQ